MNVQKKNSARNFLVHYPLPTQKFQIFGFPPDRGVTRGLKPPSEIPGRKIFMSPLWIFFSKFFFRLLLSGQKIEKFIPKTGVIFKKKIFFSSFLILSTNRLWPERGRICVPCRASQSSWFCATAPPLRPMSDEDVPEMGEENLGYWVRRKLRIFGKK